MSVEAPERIWVTGSFSQGQYAHGSWNASNRYNPKADYSGVEYVRADKLEELAAALRIAQGNTDAAIEDYNEAQAALAEAKRENEALRKQVMMLGVQLDDMMFLSVEGFLDWKRACQLERARNAGGKDEPCRGCGDGDKVPASGYWRCPVCDAEWSGEDAE